MVRSTFLPLKNIQAALGAHFSEAVPFSISPFASARLTASLLHFPSKLSILSIPTWQARYGPRGHTQLPSCQFPSPVIGCLLPTLPPPGRFLTRAKAPSPQSLWRPACPDTPLAVLFTWSPFSRRSSPHIFPLLFLAATLRRILQPIVLPSYLIWPHRPPLLIRHCLSHRVGFRR